MAPVKFDDIPQVANQVLKDDYQSSGYVLKAKQKTTWGGAVLSQQVDLFAEDKCSTPAKLTWKVPKPFGCDIVTVDKLEMDKGGKFKFEASSASKKLPPGLKLECKSDLKDKSKIVAGCTYTGLKDAQIKFECKAFKPKDFTGEVMYEKSGVTGGVKFTGAVLSGGLPDVGLRVLKGNGFFALQAKEKLRSFDVAAHYKVCPDVRCAASYKYEVADPKKANLQLAVAYKNLYKLSLSQDKSIRASAKYDVAKGFSLLGGVQYKHGGKGNPLSYGLQVSVE